MGGALHCALYAPLPPATSVFITWAQTTTQLPQSTTNLPHVHVLYVVYMAFYVICHILNSCMPNWQQLAMEGAVTASLPDDGHDRQKTACRLRGQTEYLI